MSMNVRKTSDKKMCDSANDVRLLFADDCIDQK